jgi:riboflavin synthase
MFTGIVEQLGTVASIVETATGRRLVVEGEGLGDLPLGASIAVNGVCLTVVSTDRGSVALDVIPETLSRTNLGGLVTGDSVNLERPMPASGRFDGHIVSGHVDAVGVVVSLESEADGAVVMEISVAPELTRYLVEKGSITVDGVSLTVAALTDDGFTVALIPHTLEITTLGLRAPRDTVNLEMDVLAKYVERLMTFNS